MPPTGRSRTGYIPPIRGPLPGFPGTQRAEARQDERGHYRARWVYPDGRFFEWDYQHGTVEAYDRRGEHLGEFAPLDGRQLKQAIPTRKARP